MRLLRAPFVVAAVIPARISGAFPALDASRMPRDADSAGYMPQLDALRAFAVTLVLVHHWLPDAWLARQAPLGMFGVVLFFVLSGFLITGLLLQAREHAEAAGASRRGALARFYARRALRIFPAYYLLLAILYAVGSPQFRADIGWYAGYASNVLFWREQAWLPPAPHLWTLAVEEQIYLAWPLLVLFARRAHLGWFLGAAIVAGPLVRAVLNAQAPADGHAALFVEVLTPSCLSAFGLGGLLAAHRARWLRFPGFGRRTGTVLVGLAVIGLALLWDTESLVGVLFRTCVAVLALGAIAVASRGARGPVGALLDFAPLRYVGTISYGIYLFHVSSPALYRWLGLPEPDHDLARFGVRFAFVVLLAALSWHLFERPILALKTRFVPADAPVRRASSLGAT